MVRKKILVCGATGFIGRNMAEWFARDSANEVLAIYNRKPPFENSAIRWIKTDVLDPTQITSALDGVDILIQAAATTSGSKDIVARPYVHVTDNAVMNSYLFRAAFEKKLSHVIFFSCTVMLQSASKAQREEDFDANAEMHLRYFGAGWTKVYLEKMCEFYSRLGHTRFTAIRHSNVYGPHDKFDLERSHVFGATVTKVMKARDCLTVWGTGAESRDLLYIADLVDMVSRVIREQTAPFSVYNCGSGESVAISELVAKIVQASGRSLAVEYDPTKPTIDTSFILDCTKARRELGWAPKHTLDEGIRQTLEWWRQNISNVNGPDQDT
jgi:GDP-L-fucose synthase